MAKIFFRNTLESRCLVMAHGTLGGISNDFVFGCIYFFTMFKKCSAYMFISFNLVSERRLFVFYFFVATTTMFGAPLDKVFSSVARPS